MTGSPGDGLALLDRAARPAGDRALTCRGHRSLVKTDVARQVEDDVDRRLDQGLEPEFVMPACIGGRRARSHPVRGGRAGSTPGRRALPARDRADRGERQRLDDALGEDVDLRRARSAARASSARPASDEQMGGDGGRTKIGRRPVAARRGAAPRRAASPRVRGPRTCGPRAARRRSAAAARTRATSSTATGRTGDRQADEAEDRERVEGVAQVVEHVVAATVDDAGLQDRPGQPGARTSSSAAHFEPW